MIMKSFHLLSLVTLLLACFQLQAQKGSVVIGCNVGFAKSKYEDFSTTVRSVNPAVSYFFSNKLAAGLAFNLFSGDGLKAYSAGPRVRYYFTEGSNIRPFGQLGIYWSILSPSPLDQDTALAFGFDVGAGASFFLNDHVTLDGILGYNTGGGINTFGISIGLQAFISGGREK